MDPTLSLFISNPQVIVGRKPKNFQLMKMWESLIRKLSRGSGKFCTQMVVQTGFCPMDEGLWWCDKFVFVSLCQNWHKGNRQDVHYFLQDWCTPYISFCAAFVWPVQHTLTPQCAFLKPTGQKADNIVHRRDEITTPCHSMALICSPLGNLKPHHKVSITWRIYFPWNFCVFSCFICTNETQLSKPPIQLNQNGQCHFSQDSPHLDCRQRLQTDCHNFDHLPFTDKNLYFWCRLWWWCWTVFFLVACNLGIFCLWINLDFCFAGEANIFSHPQIGVLSCTCRGW